MNNIQPGSVYINESTGASLLVLAPDENGVYGLAFAPSDPSTDVDFGVHAGVIPFAMIERLTEVPR